MALLLLLFQDASDVARAQIEQLAAGLKLYAEIHGGYPDALAKGFRLIDDVPKDPWGRDYLYDGKTLKSLGADEASTLDDPEYRLPEPARSPIDERRIKLELVRAAVLAHRRATRELTTSIEKSPYALVNALPAEITLTGSRDGVRITYTRNDAAPDVDRARFDALVRELGSDDVDTRDRAAAGLVELGPKALGLFKGDADPEVAARLKDAEAEILARVDFTAATRRTSVFVFPPTSGIGGKVQANERNAFESMQWLYLAQVNFKAKDVDGNKIADYWTADLRGLSCMKDVKTGQPRAEVTDPKLARADASAPLESKYATETAEYDASTVAKSPSIPAPNDGYVFFTIPLDAAGKPYAQGDGLHNPDAFAICAVPAEHGVTGERTLITSQTGVVFARDTRGRALDRFPGEDELQREWKRVE